jgi:hypothetical protein
MSVNTQASAVNCTTNRAERHVAKMLSRAASAHRNGEQKRFRHHSSAYLNSYDARLMAVQQAYEALRPNCRPAIGTLPALAAALDPWSGTNEPVRVSVKPKKNGDYRILSDFGITNRALQYLVSPLIKATTDLHPHQYGCQGGTHAAIQYVRQMQSEGFGCATCAVTTSKLPFSSTFTLVTCKPAAFVPATARIRSVFRSFEGPRFILYSNSSSKHSGHRLNLAKQFVSALFHSVAELESRQSV